MSDVRKHIQWKVYIFNGKITKEKLLGDLPEQYKDNGERILKELMLDINGYIIEENGFLKITDNKEKLREIEMDLQLIRV